MKVQLLKIWVVLLAVSICCAGFAASNAKPKGMKVVRTSGKAASKVAVAASQPTLSGTMPSATTPELSGAGTIQSQPGTMGAGPTMGQPAMPDLTLQPAQGTVAAPAPQAAGAGPATCPPCPPCQSGPTCPSCSMSVIPGFTSTTQTITTCVPCPPACPPPAPSGCGPAPCPPQPSTIVSCAANCPVYCNPCPKRQCNCDPCNPCDTCKQQPTTVCASTTVTTPAYTGAGPAACPSVAGVSACTQPLLTSLQGLCGIEADRTYLVDMMQLELQVLALSNAYNGRMGATHVEDFATNSISDANRNVRHAQSWLRTKFCMEVTACVPCLSVTLDTCNLNRAAFTDQYTSGVLQYYIDEIALSQVEMQVGCDCQVKAWAAQMIKDNQVRIASLKRCGMCTF